MSSRRQVSVQDTYCPATWIVVSAENTLHIAVAEAVLLVEAERRATERKFTLTNNFFGALSEPTSRSTFGLFVESDLVENRMFVD